MELVCGWKNPVSSVYIEPRPKHALLGYDASDGLVHCEYPAGLYPPNAEKCLKQFEEAVRAKATPFVFRIVNASGLHCYDWDIQKMVSIAIAAKCPWKIIERLLHLTSEDGEGDVMDMDMASLVRLAIANQAVSAVKGFYSKPDVARFCGFSSVYDWITECFRKKWTEQMILDCNFDFPKVRTGNPRGGAPIAILQILSEAHLKKFHKLEALIFQSVPGINHSPSRFDDY